LLALQSKYTTDHPDVIKAKNDIATLTQKIAEAEQQRKNAPADKSPKSSSEPTQVLQLRAQIHQYDQVIKERTQQQEDIQKQINLYQSRVQASPAVEQEYKLLTRDHQVVLDSYNEMVKKRDQSEVGQRLVESQKDEHFVILDPANLPDSPSFPKLPLFAGGGFGAGLALGLGLTLLLELHDTSLRSERDVEVVLRLPVLAMIPVITENPGKTRARSSILGSYGAKQITKA